MTREKYGQQRREEQSKGEERRGEKKERRGEASRQEKSRAEHRRGHASTREESTVQQRRERHTEESGRLHNVPSATFAKPSACAGVSRIRRRPPATATQTLETLRNTPDNLLAHARRPPHSAPHGPSPDPARGGAKRRDIRRATPCRGARRLLWTIIAASARHIACPIMGPTP